MKKRFTYILLILPCIFLASCSSSKKVAPEVNSPVDYRLVYTIHADANYSYHVEGKRFKADQKVLKEAKKVAVSSTQGEVFIFHQRPERKFLLLFPRKDRRWYHYRNGELIAEGKYSPKDGGLTEESEIYNQRKSGALTRNIFLYFGHEIPSQTDVTYHQSRPDYLFNTTIFSNDLRKFEDHFELTVLSTCNNGNPLMVDQLQGKTNYLIASPRNLHLSHLDTHRLQLLEENPGVSTDSLARSLAKSSFHRLSKLLQTMVTVGVYNLNETKTYLGELSSRYEEHLKSINQHTLFKDNIDCQNLDIFKEKEIQQKGVKLYYKPAAFGRQANRPLHSTWGCKE